MRITGDNEYELLPLGDSAVIVRFEQRIGEDIHNKVNALISRLEQEPFAGLVECVPSFAAVTIHYHPYIVASRRPEGLKSKETVYETVCAYLRSAARAIASTGAYLEPRVVEIPVCYDQELGPDLSYVAQHNGLDEEEVIAIHTSAVYTVFMIGFAPGFPYLGGMSERIAAPRRGTPRPLIPAGSVGIAGSQTGVYSVPTPGGWQLIGRTPLALFRPLDEIPSLLQPGDTVRFTAIGREQYDNWKEEKLR